LGLVLTARVRSQGYGISVRVREQEERVEEMIDAISHHVEVINRLKGDLRDNKER
jgi:hypothetical protein